MVLEMEVIIHEFYLETENKTEQNKAKDTELRRPQNALNPH